VDWGCSSGLAGDWPDVASSGDWSGGIVISHASTMLEHDAQRFGFREWLASAIGSPQQIQIFGFIDLCLVTFSE